MSNRGLFGLPQGQRSGSTGSSVSYVNDFTTASITLGAASSYPDPVDYISSTDRVVIIGQNAQEAYLINPATNAVVSTVSIATTTSANTCLFLPSSNFVYVVGLNHIKLLNTDLSYAGQGTPGGTPSLAGLAFVPAQNRLYSANQNTNTIYWITPNLSTNGTLSNSGSGYVTSPSPRLVYVPTVDRLYLATSGSTSITVINQNTDSVAATITLPSGCRGILYTEDSNRVWAAMLNGNVALIDPSTNTIVTTISPGVLSTHMWKWFSDLGKVYLYTSELQIWDSKNVIRMGRTSDTPMNMCYVPGSKKVFYTTQTAGVSNRTAFQMLAIKEIRYVY